MDRLRLIRRLYVTKTWKVLFLMLQIFSLVIFFQASFYPFEKIAKFSNDMKACFTENTKKILHFDPYAGIEENGEFERQSQNEEFKRKVESCQDYVKKIGKIAELKADILVDEKSASIANLIVYSNDLYEMTNLTLTEGEFIRQTNELAKTGYVPVIVSGELAKDHQVGDIIEISTSFDGKKEYRINAVITGVLDETKPAVTIHYGGTTKQLDTVGFYPASMVGYSFIFVVENESFHDLVEWNYPLLFELKNANETEETVEKLSGILSEYGTVDPYAKLEEQSWYWTAFEYQWEILLCMIFVPILIFGFGGYLFIHLIQNKQHMAVFYLIGMSKKRIFLLYSIATEIIIGFPIIVAALFTKPIMKKIYGIDNVSLGLIKAFSFFIIFSAVAVIVNGRILLKKSQNEIMMISREGIE